MNSRVKARGIEALRKLQRPSLHEAWLKSARKNELHPFIPELHDYEMEQQYEREAAGALRAQEG